MKKFIMTCMVGMLMVTTEGLLCTAKEEAQALIRRKKITEETLPKVEVSTVDALIQNNSMSAVVLAEKITKDNLTELKDGVVITIINAEPQAALPIADAITKDNLLKLSQKIDIIRKTFQNLPPKKLNEVSNNIADIIEKNNDILMNLPQNFLGAMALISGGQAVERFTTLAEARKNIEEENLRLESEKKLQKKPSVMEQYAEKAKKVLGYGNNGNAKK